MIEVGTRHLPEHRGGARGRHESAARARPARARERPRDRRGRHPSVLALVRRSRDAEPALRPDRLRPADRGARQPHLRPARPRRRRGPRDAHRAHEPGALLPAAHPRAVDELAVLARSRHGLDELPREGLRPLPAHRHPRSILLVADYTNSSSCSSRRTASTTPKKIWWDVRPHPFYPTLEYRICDIPMRVDETICIAALFQAITAKLWLLHARTSPSALLARADHREQVARRALRDRRQADRLRQAGRGAVRRPPRGAPRVRRRRRRRARLAKEVEYVRTIVERRTGAERQLAVSSRGEARHAKG